MPLQKKMITKKKKGSPNGSDIKGKLLSRETPFFFLKQNVLYIFYSKTDTNSYSVEEPD